MRRYARVLTFGILGVALLALAVPAFAGPQPRGRSSESAPRVQSLGVAALAADDEIPGIAAPVGTISGALDEYTDIDDVYSVNLVAGQVFGASIYSLAGADFDLYLFAPGATSVWTDRELASAQTESNPDAFSVSVPAAGTYFLNASAFSGNGDYTITINENVPPTVAIGPPIDRGEFTSVDITAADTGGSGVRRITYTVDNGTPVAVTGSRATVVVSEAGNHTITATATDGSYNPSPPSVMTFLRQNELPVLELAATKTAPAYGEWITLTASLKHASSRAPIVGAPIMIVSGFNGRANFRGSGVTDANGVVRVSVRADTTKELFRAWNWADSVYRQADSSEVAVTPRVSLSRPNAPTTMLKGKTAVVYGYMKPRHVAGTYPVRVYRYRYENGRWKAYGYQKAKAANYVFPSSKYSKAMSLPYKGRWRLRAFAPEDAQHSATWSSYEYVTVK